VKAVLVYGGTTAIVVVQVVHGIKYTGMLSRLKRNCGTTGTFISRVSANLESMDKSFLSDKQSLWEVLTSQITDRLSKNYPQGRGTVNIACYSRVLEYH
jgi:hypothetical protein